MRARWTILGGLITALMLTATVAVAEEPELHPADRALIHSYDPDAMRLLYSVTDTESECEVDTDATYTYEIDEEGTVTVTDGEGGTLEGCDFSAVDVAGPEGQVNHGTVVSSFVHALRQAGYEGGIGCYVRIIAQSDYGKGDQQVNIEDVDSDAEVASSGQARFTVSETTCGKPAGVGAGTGSGEGKPEGVGRPEGAGKPEGAGRPAGRP